MRTRPIFAHVFLGLITLSLIVPLAGCRGTASSWNNAMGRRAYKNGNYTAARRHFERALLDDPWRADYAYNVASAMRQQGDPIAAERMYDHAITLDPEHQPSYHSLASLLKEQGRDDDAYELLTAWSDTQPYVPESHIEMASYQQEMGNLDAAQMELEQAYQMYPNHPGINAQLGQVYESRGDQRRAARMYRRSLAMRRYQPHVSSRLYGMDMMGQPSPGMAMAQRGGYAGYPNVPMMADPMYSGMPGYPQMAGYNSMQRRGLFPGLRNRMAYNRMYRTGMPMNYSGYGAAAYQPQAYSTFPTQPIYAGPVGTAPALGTNIQPQHQLTTPAPWPYGTQPIAPQIQAAPGTTLSVPQPQAIPGPTAVIPGQPSVTGAYGLPQWSTGGVMHMPPQPTSVPVQLGSPIPATSVSPAPIPTMTNRLPVVPAF